METHDAIVTKIGHGSLGAKEMYDRIALTDEIKSDPLMGAAWKGVLLICLLGVTFVSGLGFLIYSYLSAQSRKLDFAILRTVGFSLRQISGLVCFEQFLVIFAGIGFGVLTGSWLNSIMVPFLQLTGQGNKVLPPFMPAMDWGMIGISYGFLFAAFAVTILVIILYFSRVAIYQTLRMGDQ
jgi:ABC-type antimicrobial peptide transport system permease subunit